MRDTNSPFTDLIMRSEHAIPTRVDTAMIRTGNVDPCRGAAIAGGIKLRYELFLQLL